MHYEYKLAKYKRALIAVEEWTCLARNENCVEHEQHFLMYCREFTRLRLGLHSHISNADNRVITRWWSIYLKQKTWLHLKLLENTAIQCFKNGKRFLDHKCKYAPRIFLINGIRKWQMLFCIFFYFMFKPLLYLDQYLPLKSNAQWSILLL